MTLVESLLRVRELIANGWAQDWYSYDANGKACHTVDDENACCFCLGGAIMKVENNGGHWETESVIGILVWEKFRVGIPFWNDQVGRTKQEVLDLLDEAVASVQS